MVIIAGAIILHYNLGQINLFIGGLLGCLIVMFIFYTTGGMGAGDVKLAGAVGALLGYWRGIQVVILALLLSVLFMLFYKALHGELRAFLNELKVSFKMLFKTGSLRNFNAVGSRQSIPLGVFFLPAALIYMMIERWPIF